jgi:hypothetical protein
MPKLSRVRHECLSEHGVSLARQLDELHVIPQVRTQRLSHSWAQLRQIERGRVCSGEASELIYHRIAQVVERQACRNVHGALTLCIPYRSVRAAAQQATHDRLETLVCSMVDGFATIATNRALTS